MTIKTHMTDDKKALTIAITGDFGFSQFQSFKDAYSNVDNIGIKFVVDLSRVDHIDSSALGMLLLLKDHADEISGDIVISRPNEVVKQILEIAQFGKLMIIS